MSATNDRTTAPIDGTAMPTADTEPRAITPSPVLLPDFSDLGGMPAWQHGEYAARRLRHFIGTASDGRVR
jgi:hypothetical protein